MTRWSKVRAVATWEFTSTVKRVGYLVTTFGMPVFVLLYGGVISLIGLFIHEKENEVRVYAVVDRADVLQLDRDAESSAIEIPDEIRSALESMEQQSAMTPGLSWWKNYVFRPFDDQESAREALLSSEVRGIFVLPDDYIASGRVDIFSKQRADFSGSDSRGALKNLLLERMLAGSVAAEVAERVRNPIAETSKWTVTPDGRVEKRDIIAIVARLVVPIVFTIMLFVSLMMSAGYLLQGTAIEKENKLAEVILSSANPEEIMSGKLLGLAGAGLLQITVWFGMFIGAGLLFAGTLQLGGVEVPWFGMMVGVFFFIGGYLFLGSLMLGTGSLGSNMRESQQLSMVWIMLNMIPMVFMQILIFEPNGTLARVFSWIPFTAPVTVVLRTTLEPEGIALWEVAGSLAMMAGCTWMAIRLGARLFRVGLLLTGARPKLREILRQARLST